jgi:hypothetical protein
MLLSQCMPRGNTESMEDIWVANVWLEILNPGISGLLKHENTEEIHCHVNLYEDRLCW